MRWPWSKPRVTPRPRASVWPKRVYFLDGPMQGEVREGAGPGYEVVIPYNPPRAHPVGALTWEFPGFLMSDPPEYPVWRYAWETCYPRAEVAYVRFIA
jgi:hypothetical protein